jgi:hypothetical protein
MLHQPAEEWQMTSRNMTADVMEFLASYRNAFQSYDTDAIVAHYCFPCQLVSDAEPVAVTAIEGPEQCRAAVGYILSLHREIGVTSSRITQLDISELSPRLTGMMLRYELVDSDGQAALRHAVLLFAAADRSRLQDRRIDPQPASKTIGPGRPRLDPDFVGCHEVLQAKQLYASATEHA